MFPKTGKVFPKANAQRRSELNYASAIAAALRSELGATHQAVKTVMRWTGANERTVKNWLAGTNGPSGDHLLAIARHSDSVFETFARLSGRQHSIAAERLIAARTALLDLLDIIQLVTDQPDLGHFDGLE